MNHDSFSQLYYYLKVYERVKYYYLGNTWSVNYYRSNLKGVVYSDSIIVTTNWLYFPSSILKKFNLEKNDMKDFFNRMIVDSDSEYTCKDSFEMTFDVDYYFRKVVDNSSAANRHIRNLTKCEMVEMDPDTYYNSLLNCNRNDPKMLCRLYPKHNEVSIYQKLLEQNKKLEFTYFEWDDIQDLILMCNKADEELDELKLLFYTVYQKRTFKKKDEMADLTTDFKTLLEENLRDNLTYKRFKYWERSRHEIFSQTCFLSMGINDLTETDVNMQLKYNYYGMDHQKTPDYVDNENSLILDFSVTSGNAGNVRDQKIKKYSDLASGFSEHMNKKYKSEAIVWKITNRKEFQIPQEYNKIRDCLNSSTTLDFLYKMNMAVKLDPNYEKYKRMSDREADIEEWEEDQNLFLFDKLITATSKNKIKEKDLRTVDLNDSRIRIRGAKAKFMKFKETSYYYELKKMNDFDEEAYISNLKKEMIGMSKKEEYPNYFKNMFMDNKEKVKDILKKNMLKQQEIRRSVNNNINMKIPKLFKSIFFYSNSDAMPNYMKGNNLMSMSEFETFSDGTSFYTGMFDYQEIKDEEKKDKYFEYNTDGIGMDSHLDFIMMENLFDFMKAPSKRTDASDFLKMDMKEELKQFLRSNAWSMIESMSNVYENLCYMEGRRHFFNQSKGHTVCKNFGSYLLMVKAGSKLTSQKQIRYKVIIPKDNLMMDNNKIMHTMKEVEDHSGLLSSKWLTASITDIKHYSKMKEVALALMSSILDKDLEDSRGKSRTMNLLTNVNMAYLMILMENKRGTSTSLQLNRYLVHSATSYISNREKLATDIFDEPTRTYGESYIKMCQAKWFEHMIPLMEDLTKDRIMNMTSTSNDYDRLHLPSFYDLNENIEFSRVMDEMYLCNLFDKEAGFNSHRMKQIVNKQEIMEIKFQENRHLDESKGIVNSVSDFLKKDDQFHTFDFKYVASATRRFFKSKVNKVKLKEAEMTALNSVINSAMMMTASLKSGPYESEALEFSDKLVKSRSFLTLFEEVEKLSTSTLAEMCSKMDTVDAIFAIFPKAQIGGPREILIQSVLLRIIVKFLETYAKMISKTHEKEMLTKSHQRSEIQSDTLAEMREIMRSTVKKGNGALFFSLNSDASKWSPSFVMENFMAFVENWDINCDVKNVLLSVISSFSSKKMMVPDELKRKWENKDKNLREYSDGAESFKQQAYNNNYVVELMSGMGQGMFHYLSSLYHCVMDDLMEEVTKDVLVKSFKTSLYQRVMKSSDDSTTIGMFILGKNLNFTDDVLKNYLFLYDSMNRLANIHTNWKKSGLNFIISEFNSLFSIGKRMVWATIKDVYTANSIPDLTSPEEAVIFMNSNLRRAFEHGIYLSTINVMMKLCRNQLKRYYKFSKEDIEHLKMRFNCCENMLPYQLGFYPLEMPVENMLFGVEVNMFNVNNTPELKKFYKNLYTAEKTMPISTSKNMVPFSEEAVGKFWYELPSRLDKKLVDLKNTFFKEMINMTAEEINKSMERNSMNFNLSNADMKNYNQFTMEYFVGMNRKYEFQETMVVHSLVRALQMSKSKGNIFPKLFIEKLDIEEVANLKEKYNDSSLTKDERDIVVLEFKEKELKLEKHTCDILGFVDFIMDRSEDRKSSLSFYQQLEKVALNHKFVLDSIQDMNKVTKYYHPSMKTLRFYASDMMLNLNSEEILNYIFDNKKELSNSMEMAVEELCKISNQENTREIYNNPFGFVKKFMNNSDRPFKDFKDFLKFNQRSMKFLKVTMLSDTFDAGSMEENILNLYKTRFTPKYTFEKKSESWKQDLDSLSFLSGVSLNHETKISMEDAMLRDISNSDSKLMRAMKLHMLSGKAEQESTSVNYNRVEFKDYYDNKKVKTLTWTNLNLLIIAKVRGKYVDVYTYSTNLMERSSENNRLMNLYNKDVSKLEEEGCLVKHMNRFKWSENYKMYYNSSNIKFKTEIRKRPTKWQMMLVVSASRFMTFRGNDTTTSTFTVLTDNYTVDNNTLMNMYIEDSFGDPMMVQDLIEEVPDLKTLDEILIKNSWITEINLKEVEGFSSRSEADDKRAIQDINESFGMESMKSTLMSLVPTGILEENLQDDELENDLDSVKNEDLNLNTAKSALESFLNSLKNEDDFSLDSSSEEIQIREKSSIMRITDRMITDSMLSTLDLDRKKMGSYWTAISNSKSSSKQFHNMVLWQVRNAFDFELSNTMSLILYNSVIKNYMTTVMIKPITDLKWLDKSIKKNIKEESIFIHKKKDLRVYTEVLDLFE